MALNSYNTPGLQGLRAFSVKPNLPAWTLSGWPKETWPWVVQWSCAICLYAHDILMQSNKHFPNRNAPNPPPSCRSGPSVWPQSMSQFFNTSIVEVCRKPTQGPSRSRKIPPAVPKSRWYAVISHKRWNCWQYSCLAINQTNLQVPVRESHLSLSSACARSCTLGFRIWPPPKLHDCGDLEIPETGGFSRRIKRRSAFAFFLFFIFYLLFFFCLGLRLSVARHERESGGAHVVKCDMFGSGLAPVGDEIRICPGDLSRLLVLGSSCVGCLFRHW